MAVYDRYPFIREQLSYAANRRAGFTKSSATLSSEQSAPDAKTAA